MPVIRKIRCPRCGHLNVNRDFCENCGALINPDLIREEQIKKRIAKREEKARNRKKSALELWMERNRNHPNVIIRYLFRAVYSVFLLVMAIGAFIAWLVGIAAV